MPHLELALISGDYQLAIQAEKAGIDRIFFDLETLGKQERQAGEGLFLSQHCLEDLPKVASVLTQCRLMVRINSFHENTPQEIEKVLKDGAQIIMLPMFENAFQVREFISLVEGRATTSLLLENKVALDNIEEIVKIPGIDEIHIGLNDLRLSFGLDVIFEVLCHGVIDFLSEVIRGANIRFGFGGVSSPNATHLPVNPKRIIAEQIRLGSTVALLGRSFREPFEDLSSPDKLAQEVKAIRQCVSYWQNSCEADFLANRNALVKEVESWKISVRRNSK